MGQDVLKDFNELVGKKHVRLQAAARPRPSGEKRVRSRRAFQFPCNNPACANTEESMQRRLNKCVGCHGLRYCSDACRRVDWRAHKLACRRQSGTGELTGS